MTKEDSGFLERFDEEDQDVSLLQHPLGEEVDNTSSSFVLDVNTLILELIDLIK